MWPWNRAVGAWNLRLGARGERVAARALRRAGLRVIARNLRTRYGELDLIARRGGLLVFVEVKTRVRGEPLEAVTPEKQRRVTRTALAFLREHGLLEAGVTWRFDVVAVVWPEGRGRPEVEHIPHAFEAIGVSSMFS
jgi:putative endonuclease